MNRRRIGLLAGALVTLTALVAGGLSPGSAEVWTVRCAWLRPSGRRGQYILAGCQEAGANFAASA